MIYKLLLSRFKELYLDHSTLHNKPWVIAITTATIGELTSRPAKCGRDVSSSGFAINSLCARRSQHTPYYRVRKVCHVPRENVGRSAGRAYIKCFIILYRSTVLSRQIKWLCMDVDDSAKAYVSSSMAHSAHVKAEECCAPTMKWDPCDGLHRLHEADQWPLSSTVRRANAAWMRELARPRKHDT